jgi:hypothetical protein
MGEELEDELDVGYQTARKLVEHLIAMGAGKAEIPVTVGGQEYTVTVESVRKRTLAQKLTPHFCKDWHGRGRLNAN